MTPHLLDRRAWVARMAAGAAGFALFGVRPGWADTVRSDEDVRRLRAWVAAVRAAGVSELGPAATVAGEQAIGTPYEPFTLESYLEQSGDPTANEPLALSLTRFDCVTLVESCVAIARLARFGGEPAWEGFGREVAALRYRGGTHGGYADRLHYFSEWISDNAARGALRDLGAELGGVEDRRPLRFMTSNPDSYLAMRKSGEVVRSIAARERALDASPRHVVPTARIPDVEGRIRTGDILAFATSIEGLDVTHAAFAYRDAGGTLRVLHAPLSGGSVEITRTDLLGYVKAIRRATGILVARPLA